MAKKRQVTNDTQLQEKLNLKGLEGCLWRWLLIGASAKAAYKDAVEAGDQEQGYLEEQETLVKLITTAVVIQTPALAYYEAYKHCRQIATRDLLARCSTEMERVTGDDKLSDLMGALPSNTNPVEQLKTVLQHVVAFSKDYPEEHFDEKFAQRCDEWLCAYPWQLHQEAKVKPMNLASLFIYDEIIENVGDENVPITQVYQEKEQVALAGHLVHADWVVALLFRWGLGNESALRPYVEWRVTPTGTTDWMLPTTYTGRIMDRFITRCGVKEAFVQKNAKLSFKRRFEKIRKQMGAILPPGKRMPVTWYELKTNGIDMFHDVAIRRGYKDKEQEAQEIASKVDEAEKQFESDKDAMRDTSGTMSSATVHINIDHGHRAIVERFIATRQIQEGLAQKGPNEDSRRFCRGMNHLLRQARIIEIPWKFYWKQVELAFVNSHNRAALHWEEDEYLAKDWASLTENIRKLKNADRDMCDEISIMAIQEMKRIPWNPEMPFPICWLGYDTPIGGAVTVQPDGTEDYFSKCYRLGSNIDPKVDGLPYLYGHLLTKEEVYAFFTLIKHDAQGQFTPMHKVFALVEREGGQWHHPLACSSLTLANIVRFIEEHQIVIEQSPSLRKTNDRIARRISKAQRRKVEPLPYYTVYIKDGVYDVKKDPSRVGTRGELTYSHDRAGGTYYKVRRGPLPLDSKEKTKLERRKYVVFTDTKPYGEWAEAIKKRGARPKSPDEWIAILKWRRRDTVVRPDLPKYIPSVRRSEKHKERR